MHDMHMHMHMHVCMHVYMCMRMRMCMCTELVLEREAEGAGGEHALHHRRVVPIAPQRCRVQTIELRAREAAQLGLRACRERARPKGV